ncbi:MAG TPA: hypothetical protein O0X27_06560 [Methanocorpusculum sp.]|nr:hypothetical protein [Methanocorpusculum sp.]
MTLDDLGVESRILRELGEISTAQKHMQTDIADIKTEIRVIRQANEQIEERVRTLETVQAECRGKNTVALSAFNKGAALVSGIISAVVAGLIALFTGGGMH